MSLMEIYKNFKAKKERRKGESLVAAFMVNDARCFIVKHYTKEGPYLEAYLDGNWNCCASYENESPESLNFCIESLINDALKLK